MASNFLRKFSLSSSPPSSDENTMSGGRRKSSSASNSGRVLGARDYKLASSPPKNDTETPLSSSRRRSSVAILPPTDENPKARILGARDYQHAISPADIERRRSSVTSTLVDYDILDPKPLGQNDTATSTVVTGEGGRIYGARDYKVLAAMTGAVGK